MPIYDKPFNSFCLWDAFVLAMIARPVLQAFNAATGANQHLYALVRACSPYSARHRQFCCHAFAAARGIAARLFAMLLLFCCRELVRLCCTRLLCTGVYRRCWFCLHAPLSAAIITGQRETHLPLPGCAILA
jgi:hypothetical protein